MEPTRENTEIISVNITPNKIFIQYAIYVNEILTNHKVEYLSKQKPIHADFRKSIEAMDTHLHGVFMFPTEAIDRVSVSGIEIQSKNHNDSVKIIGKYALASGNSTNIKTDFIRFEPDDQPYTYEEVENIEIDTNTIREEAYRYLFEDKQAQLSLFDKQGDAVVDVPDNPNNF